MRRCSAHTAKNHDSPRKRRIIDHVKYVRMRNKRATCVQPVFHIIYEAASL